MHMNMLFRTKRSLLMVRLNFTQITCKRDTKNLFNSNSNLSFRFLKFKIRFEFHFNM